MPKFKIVPDINAVPVAQGWSKTTTYNKKVTVDGHTYQLEKHYRAFSHGELFLRALGGCLAVIFSLGLALCSKHIRKLFTQENQTSRFGVLVNKKPPGTEESSSSSESSSSESSSGSESDLSELKAPTAHSVPHSLLKNVDEQCDIIALAKQNLPEKTDNYDLEQIFSQDKFTYGILYGMRLASTLENKKRIVDALCDFFNEFIVRANDVKTISGPLSSCLSQLTYFMFSTVNYYQWHDKDNKSVFNCTTWTDCPTPEINERFYVCQNYNNLPNICKPLLELLISHGANLTKADWRKNMDREDKNEVQRKKIIYYSKDHVEEWTSPFKVFHNTRAHRLTRFNLSKMLILEIKNEQFCRKLIEEKGTANPASAFLHVPKEIVEHILDYTH